LAHRKGMDRAFISVPAAEFMTSCCEPPLAVWPPEAPKSFLASARAMPMTCDCELPPAGLAAAPWPPVNIFMACIAAAMPIDWVLSEPAWPWP
jgi:hypothetical protein